MPHALLFTIDATRYAIPLADVAEVLPAVNILALPDAPAIVEGVVNVRGEIVPVLSLRAKLGHTPRRTTASEYFILVNALRRRVIVRSDTAPEIASLPELDAWRDEAVDCALAGVLPLSSGVALLQDINRFIAADEEPTLDAALAVRATV